MFSVGVILFFLLAGYHPFDVDGQRTSEEIESSICSGSWHFDHETWSWVDPSSKNVVVSLLEVDPLKRMTAPQLRLHKWIEGSRCSALNNRRITVYRDYGQAKNGGNKCPKRKSDEISSIGFGSDALGEDDTTIVAHAINLEEYRYGEGNHGAKETCVEKDTCSLVSKKVFDSHDLSCRTIGDLVLGGASVDSSASTATPSESVKTSGIGAQSESVKTSGKSSSGGIPQNTPNREENDSVILQSAEIAKIFRDMKNIATSKSQRHDYEDPRSCIDFRWNVFSSDSAGAASPVLSQSDSLCREAKASGTGGLHRHAKVSSFKSASTSPTKRGSSHLKLMKKATVSSSLGKKAGREDVPWHSRMVEKNAKDRVCSSNSRGNQKGPSSPHGDDHKDSNSMAKCDQKDLSSLCISQKDSSSNRKSDQKSPRRDDQKDAAPSRKKDASRSENNASCKLRV
jgi:hypothetical protein